MTSPPCHCGGEHAPDRDGETLFDRVRRDSAEFHATAHEGFAVRVDGAGRLHVQSKREDDERELPAADQLPDVEVIL